MVNKQSKACMNQIYQRITEFCNCIKYLLLWVSSFFHIPGQDVFVPFVLAQVHSFSNSIFFPNLFCNAEKKVMQQTETIPFLNSFSNWSNYCSRNYSNQKYLQFINKYLKSVFHISKKNVLTVWYWQSCLQISVPYLCFFFLSQTVMQFKSFYLESKIQMAAVKQLNEQYSEISDLNSSSYRYLFCSNWLIG